MCDCNQRHCPRCWPEACEGWSNYETWLVNMWMSNNYAVYQYFRLYVEEVNKHCPEPEEKIAIILESLVESNLPDIGDFYAMLLNAAIKRVNFRELAESWVCRDSN